MKHIGRLLPLLVPFLLLLVGCDLLADTPVDLTASPAASAAPTATAGPAGDDTAAEATLPPSSPAPPLLPLRVWLPPEIGARTPEGAQLMADQVRAFESTQTELDVVVEQKPAEGAGGILSYLRTGTTVAPTILPDVIALPTSAIADPAVRQLLFPLDGLIDPIVAADAYPDASAQVTVDDRLFGVPFVAAGLPHLVYASVAITDTVPLDWTTFISDTNHTLVLPADSRDGALFGLEFYLAEGGTLVNEACLLYTSPSPRDGLLSRMPSSA